MNGLRTEARELTESYRNAEEFLEEARKEVESREEALADLKVVVCRFRGLGYEEVFGLWCGGFSDLGCERVGI